MSTFFLDINPDLNFKSAPATLKYLRIIKFKFFCFFKNFSTFNFDFAYILTGFNFDFSEQ